MDKPFIGLTVWFFRGGPGADHLGPLAATVCKINTDNTVNLMVIGENGVAYPVTRAPLVRAGETINGDYCTAGPLAAGALTGESALAGARR